MSTRSGEPTWRWWRGGRRASARSATSRWGWARRASSSSRLTSPSLGTARASSTTRLATSVDVSLAAGPGPGVDLFTTLTTRTTVGLIYIHSYLHAVDHLVNNASIWQVCKFEEIQDVRHLRALMDINFWGHVYPTRLAIPHLRRSRGRIVGVTSNSSYIFIGRNTFYNVKILYSTMHCADHRRRRNHASEFFSLLSQASKAAALSFYDTLRMELGSDIRITEVVPGVVESEITKGKMLTKGGEMKVDQDERDVRTSVGQMHARV